MSFVTKVLGMDNGGGLGGVLGLVAPFLPGPYGAIAGVASQLPGINKAQGKMDDATAQLQSLADLLSSGFMQNAGALNEALLQGAGIGNRLTPEQKAKESQIIGIKSLDALNKGKRTPTTVAMMEKLGVTDADIAAYNQNAVPQYDPNSNPYGQFINDTYSQGAIDQRANALFDPSSPEVGGQLANMEAGTRSAFDGAVRAAEADAARRGVLASSGAASRINALRAQQATANTANQNQLLGTLAGEERAYRVGEQQTGNALFARGIDQQRNNLLSTYGLLSGGVDRGAGILGGLQGIYASDVANRQQGLGNMIGSIAGTGTLEDIFKRPGLPTGSTPPFNPNAGGMRTLPPYNPGGAAGTVNGNLLNLIRQRP